MTKYVSKVIVCSSAHTPSALLWVHCYLLHSMCTHSSVRLTSHLISSHIPQGWKWSAWEWGELLHVVSLNTEWFLVLQNDGCSWQNQNPPLDNATNIATNHIWKKDNLVKAMIMQCMKADLVIMVAHVKHTKESWDIFMSEFSQTSSGSIMLRFRWLTKQLLSGGDISAHVTGFQEAICYLVNAEFKISGYILATILLSALPSNPKDPHS